MNTLPQTIKDYLEELETLDVRPVKYYYDVISWDLEHYDEETGEYEKKINKLFRGAYSDAAMMDNEHKGRLLSMLQEIKAKYKLFWKFWIEHNNAYKNGSFDAHGFEWQLKGFFGSDFAIESGLYTPELYLTPNFFLMLLNAVNAKEETLTRFIDNLTPPPVATSTEVKETPAPIAASTGAKEPTKDQKKALDLFLKYWREGHKLGNAKELAAKEAGYEGWRQVHNLYKEVEAGTLKHEELTEFINNR